MQQVSELTAQQKTLLGEYKKKWQQVAYSTQPIDQEKATQAIEAVYKQFYKIEDFDIYFFKSPASIANLSFLHRIYPSENWYNSKKLGNLMRKVEDKFLMGIFGKDITRNIALPLIEIIGRKIDAKTWYFINKELIFDSHLNKTISASLKDQELSSLMEEIWEAAKPSQQNRLEVIWRNLSSYKPASPSEQCSDCCILDYCFSELNCIYNEHLWRILKAFVSECGLTFFYKDCCFVCDRPTKILLDDQNRPHSENEAAIEFSDGFKIFAEHGYLTDPSNVD